MRILLLTSALLAGTTLSANAEVLARVNNQRITSEQVEFQLNQIPEQLRAQQNEEQLRRNILDRLIEQELVQQDAKRQRLQRDPEFREQLGNVQRSLVYNTMVNRKLEEVITPERLQAEYQALAPQIQQPAVRASHILVEEEAAARDLINQLNNGTDFAELASANSLDNGAAQTGGDLGWFGQNDMVPAFSEAAFGMAAGETSSEPVQTPFGWHVIRVVEKNDAYIPPFQQMAPAIQQRLVEQTVQAYVDGLREKARVKYTDAAPQAAN